MYERESWRTRQERARQNVIDDTVAVVPTLVKTVEILVEQSFTPEEGFAEERLDEVTQLLKEIKERLSMTGE